MGGIQIVQLPVQMILHACGIVIAVAYNMGTAEDILLSAICGHTGPNLSDLTPLGINHAECHLWTCRSESL